MKVILHSDVLGLGEEGDVCDVKPGYARNYLLKRNLAVPFTKHNLTVLGQRRRVIDERKHEKRQHASTLKEQLEALELSFAMTAGETGKLFGSVTNQSVASKLEELGFEIDRKRIEVPDHSIKQVGEHSVLVKLYEKEEANVKVVVEAQSEE